MKYIQQEGLEYCPRCNATLSFQKGYDPALNYWICKGCGEMLINPDVESDIAWICDECGAMLNVQSGFSEDCGEWTCTECGFVNKISPNEIYGSEEEFQTENSSPYKGLSDEDLLTLSEYEEISYINERKDIILVRDQETGEYYIEKFLSNYNKSIYSFLMENPLENMPGIKGIFESKNFLIVLEEFIEGITIEDLLEKSSMSEKQAVEIAIKVCRILDKLHNLQTPIIHRDVKPSNIIISENDEVYLLDMNVAKWFDPDKTDDTKYMGTQFYAAPEQVGYGMRASSAKSDIYAVGMLLNVMITRKFPKEEKAPEDIWKIIERCISLEADKRYTAEELIVELEKIKGILK